LRNFMKENRRLAATRRCAVAAQYKVRAHNRNG
jgi:hypothetical protein